MIGPAGWVSAGRRAGGRAGGRARVDAPAPSPAAARQSLVHPRRRSRSTASRGSSAPCSSAGWRPVPPPLWRAPSASDTTHPRQPSLFGAVSTSRYLSMLPGARPGHTCPQAAALQQGQQRHRRGHAGKASEQRRQHTPSSPSGLWSITSTLREAFTLRPLESTWAPAARAATFTSSSERSLFVRSTSQSAVTPSSPIGVPRKASCLMCHLRRAEPRR
jgi:hypothetical protein